MSATKITVRERNDPQVTIWIGVLKPDRSVIPYDFTGAAVEFYMKDDASDADGDPVCSTLDNTVLIDSGAPWDARGVPIVDRTEKNRINVMLSAGDLVAARTFYYRVDAIKAGKRETVISGPLVIENV